MRSRLLPSVALAALLAAGCSGGGSSTSGDAPVVLAVTPNSGTPSAPVEVTLTGQHFTVRTMQLQGGGTSVLLPRVFFGATELAPVTWIDDGTLKVTVPQDFPAGSYAVAVENGFGVRGQPLADGYLVAATPPILNGTWSVSQTLVMLGQPVTVKLVLANAAGSAPATISGVTPTASPTANCTIPAPAATSAAPVRINGGSSVEFSWTCTAAASGTTGPYQLNATVTATDAITSLPVAVTLGGTQVTYTPLPVVSVTVNGSPAAVTSSPTGIAGCTSTGGSNCSAAFSTGTAVTLTGSTTATGTWSWNGCDSSSNNTCRVNVGTTARNITATFTLTQYTVTVTPNNFNGGSGTVTSNTPAGGTAPPINLCASTGTATSGTCAGSFSYGSTVVLTATPAAGVTVSWTGCDSTSANVCTITNLQGAKPIGVTFALTAPIVTVSIPTSQTGSGTVSSDPAGITGCATHLGPGCSASFPWNATVTLTAAPGAGSSVVWAGCDAPNTQGTGNTCVVANNAIAGKTVNATFTLATPSVIVTVDGTGSGSVSAAASPAPNSGGISACTAAGGSNCSATYNYGSSVTLSASPATGSAVAWSGCTPSGNTCTVTVTQATGVTATFRGTAATPTFTPVAGTYTSVQSVVVSTTTAGATIYYTTDGSTPTAPPTGTTQTYTAPVSVGASMTLHAIGAAAGYTTSAVGTAAYVINLPSAAAPTFSPPAGTYTTAQSVALSTTTPGGQIHYTTDGSTPTTASTLYTGAVAVNGNTTINAITVATGYSNSAVATAAYTIAPLAAAPTFNPPAGTYVGAQQVSMSSTTVGWQIRYTTDGSIPTATSTLYSGPISVATNTTINAITLALGYTNSNVSTAAYTITAPQAATPTISPSTTSSYGAPVSVTITDTTPGATIYYTTDGTAPTTSSSVYVAPFSVTAAHPTVRAIATAPSYTQSGAATATYTFSSYSVTVGVSGIAGRVTSSPAGINNCTATSGTCNGNFTATTDVTLTANLQGAAGVTWGGDCAAAGTSLTCMLSSLAANANVTATFN